MPILHIRNTGQLGLAVDVPFEALPLNAWTACQNMRFRDGAAERFLGHSQSYGTLQCAPYWLFPYNDGTTQFWLYGGLTKVGATDGASHADISRTVGGAYATDLEIGWTGTVIEGIPVVNNGVDEPQMWNTPDLGTPLAALSNWPASTICSAMRGYKGYLVALDVTKSGTRYPFMVKWSHRAAAGAVPSSWDETDPAVDAAEYLLPAEGGLVVDGAQLRDFMVIYKEYQTWLMQFVGGIDIFRFTRIFDSFGAFSRRCAAEFFSGQQLVFTGDDLVLHDGQQAKSLLDTRARNLVRGNVDSTYYRRAFLTVNYQRQEVWACYPETGNSQPNVALVWNWKDNTLGLRDLPPAAHIAAGIVDPIEATETWSGAVGTWDTDLAAWGDRSFDPSQRTLLMADSVNSKLFLLESTEQFDGVDFTSYVQRVGLGFPLKQDGPPDFETMKMLSKVWPHIVGQAGETINVYIGTQQSINGPVTWGSARSFVIGTSKFIDCRAAGRLHALKFEATGSFAWKIDGFSVEIRSMGML